MGSKMNKLREAVRVRCGLHPEIDNQVKLADHLGISESQISRVLSNRRRRLTGQQIAKMAEFLEIDTTEMIQLLAADESQAVEENSVEQMQAAIMEHESKHIEQSSRLRDMVQRIEVLERAITEKERLIAGGTEGVKRTDR
tara:strand:+ start:74 stop:496 length:423 start_codon:yes stop_codon:yes gene_type:complete